MVNVGIVGLGFMGVTHIKSYLQLEGARIAAICDAVRLPVDGNLSSISGNIATTEPIQLDMSVVKAYKNYEDLLANPDIDLVDICVPTPAHPSVAIAALKSGKHVLCEKPLARTSQLARDVVAAAASAEGFFMPAMCLRFWPEWAWVKRAIDQNTYGRALAARFRRVSEPPAWSQSTYFKGDESGGALLDLHIHDTDFVQFCFGRPKAVFATGLSRFSGAIDHVFTQYQVANGASVSAEGSWLMGPGFGFNMAYTVIFENAMADYDSGRGAESLRLYEKGQSPRTIKCDGPDGYVGELQHLLDAIQTKRPPSVVTAEDGLSAVEICEAEEQSIKTGQLVAL
ncbi:MAG: Gfo/Idh/MocA family oxidoreductase [Verrucomicrobia bacterium]|nr:Gfo/Idh/MocA family oxidoreductase [Verrucomicrobiota bacterium]